jgi:hypothetical protein
VAWKGGSRKEEKKNSNVSSQTREKIARKNKKKSLTPIQSNTNGSRKKETKGKKLLGKIM